VWSHRHRTTERLRIDPVACDGVGICSHLAPSVIAVDSWGYPMLSEAPLSKTDRRAAKRAVNGCPKRALFLDPD
jgi:ferredoxin